MRSAVLFLVFNRPDTTMQVFEAIRKARPPRLYVAADGPRLDRVGEKEKCEEVRRIATAVDWDCEVKTLFREKNLGCKMGVSGGIDWFFENEEEGIILEDDCLPVQSFFLYCDELLERFRNDTRIWQICGTDYVGSLTELSKKTSYRFSKYGPIWGWASWRRAWAFYDTALKRWPEMCMSDAMHSAYNNENEIKGRLALGERLFNGEIDTWDFQWGFVKNFQSGLSVVPNGNQIINIGFGVDATHTISENVNAPRRYVELQKPLIHPFFVIPDAILDDM